MRHLPRFASRSLRAGALAAAAALAAASNSPAGGQRANGSCPPEETCSPDTPDGLYFGSAPFGDAILEGAVVAPHRTAIGGIQTVRAFLDQAAQQPFTRPYDALAAGPSFSVAAVAAENISIHGEAVGTDYLRLVETGTQNLYDRISLETSAVDHAAIVPGPADVIDDDGLTATPPVAPRWFVGGDGKAVVQLFDMQGTRLVDETATIDAPSTPALAQWDVYTFDQTLPVGPVLVKVTTGDGAAHDVNITTTDTVQSVIWTHGLSTRAPDTGLAMDEQEIFCFRAVDGGDAVLGAPWSYQVTNDLTITSSTTNCVFVKRVAAGAGTLTATAAGTSAQFAVPTNAMPTPKPTRRARATDGGPAPGERIVLGW
jgi:hypothetical protein